MFFQKPTKLPNELINIILQNLPLKDALHFFQTSKEMHEYIKSEEFWKKFGTNNFEDFSQRMGKLTDNLQKLVLNEQYTLTLAESIQNILNLPTNERAKLLFTKKQLDNLSPNILNLLIRDISVIAIQEKLITVEQVRELTSKLLDALLTINGINALRENLITFNHLKKLLSPSLLKSFLTEKGMIALREKLITPEQAYALAPYQIDAFLTANGITALREKLITLEQSRELYPEQLEALLTLNGIEALRMKIITPEQVTAAKMSKAEIETKINTYISSPKKLSIT